MNEDIWTLLKEQMDLVALFVLDGCWRIKGIFSRDLEGVIMSL